MTRDIPILFSAPMVQAELEDRKIMSRRMAKRMVKTYPNGRKTPPVVLVERDSPWTKVKRGDRLWVREEWRVSRRWDATKPADLAARSMSVMFSAGGCICNTASGIWGYEPWPAAGQFPEWAGRRRAGMHLPRWASRLTLIVLETKLEPLQSISEQDAIDEGVRRVPARADGFGDDWVYLSPWSAARRNTAAEAFKDIWCSLHGAESWEANPPIVALSFKVIKANIDAPEARIAA